MIIWIWNIEGQRAEYIYKIRQDGWIENLEHFYNFCKDFRSQVPKVKTYKSKHNEARQLLRQVVKKKDDDDYGRNRRSAFSENLMMVLWTSTTLKLEFFRAMFFHRVQSFTSLMSDLRPYIGIGSFFI